MYRYIFGNKNLLVDNFQININNILLFPYSNNKIQIKNKQIIQNELVQIDIIKGNSNDILNHKKIYTFLKNQFSIFPELCWNLFQVENVIYLIVTSINNVYILNKSENLNLTKQIKEIYNYNNNTKNTWEVIECEPLMNQENILAFENNEFIGSQNGIIKI